MRKVFLAAGAAFGLPLLMRGFQSQMAAARARQDAGSQIAPTARGPVEYALTGAAAGLPVLISHSSMGGYDQSVAAGRRFASSRVIAPSRAGYLRTPLELGQTPAAMADSFAALLDHLEVEQVVMVGYSAGSMSAIEFALRHPGRCRGLILGGAITAPLPPFITDVLGRAALSVRSDFVNWAVSGVARRVSTAAETDPDTRAILQALVDTHPVSRRFPGYANDIAHIRGFFAPLEQIQARTLLLHGDRDFLVPLDTAQKAARRIPRAELALIPGGLHDAPLRAGTVVQPVVERFLRSL